MRSIGVSASFDDLSEGCDASVMSPVMSPPSHQRHQTSGAMMSEDPLSPQTTVIFSRFLFKKTGSFSHSAPLSPKLKYSRVIKCERDSEINLERE
eukprot:sb/3479289/